MEPPATENTDQITQSIGDTLFTRTVSSVCVPAFRGGACSADAEDAENIRKVVRPERRRRRRLAGRPSAAFAPRVEVRPVAGHHDPVRLALAFGPVRLAQLHLLHRDEPLTGREA